MSKKGSSKNPLKLKAPFKWGFMNNIPGTSPKTLIGETKFSKYLFIVNTYSKITKIYSMEIIAIEEVMNKLDIFQARFLKEGEFGWCYLEIISEDSGT